MPSRTALLMTSLEVKNHREADEENRAENFRQMTLVRDTFIARQIAVRQRQSSQRCYCHGGPDDEAQNFRHKQKRFPHFLP